MTGARHLLCLKAIVVREVLRFLHQRERFAAALVRPLLWLLVFAVGFRAALGIAIMPPYQTYIPYDVYIVPGLIAMISYSTACRARYRWSTTARWAACASC